MTCQICGGKTTVIDSVSDVDEVIRRRRCKECSHTFFTRETDGDYAECYERIRLRWKLNSARRKKKNA